MTYDKSKEFGSELFGYGNDSIITHIFASACAGAVATTTSSPAENLKTV